MAKKTYYEKLKDPQWQKKRLEVMQANDFCCELCGDSSSTLNVHHREYFKGQEPWEYDIGQLSCICENCHENEHEKLDLLKWVSSFLLLDGPANREEVAYLVAGYAGMPYEGILTVSCMYDNRGSRNAYKAGAKAKKIYDEGLKKDFQKEVINNG